jgi:hypothetical protein
MVLIRWGTQTPPQILEGRPVAARIGWNLPPARFHAGGPTTICVPVRHDFPHGIRIRRLRLSLHSKPDESQKKAFQNKIRGAACMSRCQPGCSALLPPHKCGSDRRPRTGAQVLSGNLEMLQTPKSPPPNIAVLSGSRRPGDRVADPGKRTERVECRLGRVRDCTASSASWRGLFRALESRKSRLQGSEPRSTGA